MKIKNIFSKKRVIGVMSALAAGTIITAGSVAMTPADTYAATATTNKTTTITRASAKNIALKHANASANKISNYEIELDSKKGVLYYDIEFDYNNYEYDYHVNAKTGKITKVEKKAIKKATATKKTTTTAKKTTATAKITAANAKNIALKHAKVSASNITGYKSELDREDGVLIYEIDFRAGNYKYEYEINANTGRIVDVDKEFIRR